ncbi:MFS transporter [Sphingomonas oligophenolica]|uniref:MFS transporter n=1 Tax=Sphingomonas oligophenolica TaxID=301154 RepID=A0ABU9YB47_9SPHN
MNTKVRIVAALWFVSLVNYLDRVAMSFAGPSIMASLSLTPAQFGIVLSSFGFGYALALVPGGLLTDRIGVRPMLVVGPLFWALFTGVTGLVSTIAAFLVVRFCFGLSEGAFSSSLYKAVGDNFAAKQRAVILAVCMSALAIGPALAGLLVGTLVTRYSWQTMFVFMAVPALLASVVAYILVPRAGERADRDNPNELEAAVGDRPRFRQVLKRPSLWLICLSNLSSDIAQWGFNGWMPTYLAMERHIDLKHAGMLGGIPYMAGFFGLLIGGSLGSTELLHLRRGQMVIICFLAAGISLFLAYNAAALSIAVLGLSLTSFFMFSALALKGAVVIDLAPEQYRAAYFGIYTTVGQVGGASAPAIIGFMVTASGSFATGFAFMIAALCTGAVCMTALLPMLTRHRIASGQALKAAVA